MSSRLIGIILCLVGQGATAAPLDPYGPAPTPGTAEQLDRDAAFGEPGSVSRIRDWLARNPTSDKGTRALLHERLCGLFGVRGWHSASSAACAEEHALLQTSADAPALAMSRALSETLPTRAVGAAAVPLMANPLGSRSANVTVNSVVLPWFVDTGAEISVVAQSNADRMKLRYLDVSLQVGTPTAPATGRLAVIDLLRIADAWVENVPVFVLPDANLTVPGIGRIPAILGLPVLAAFGRVAWLDGGRELRLGELAPRPAGRVERIYWHDEGVGIPVRTQRGLRGAHFDSGASRTSLYAGGRALLSSAEHAAAVTRTIRVGAAGGVADQNVRELPALTLSVAGLDMRLAKVSISTDHPDLIARVGDELIAQSRQLILDFEHMTMSADPLQAAN